jgi:mannosyltransferase OCH1-like enzyme
MKIFLCCLLVVCTFLTFKKQNVPSPFISFDTAMQHADPQFPKGLSRKRLKQWNLVKQLYTKSLSRRPSLEARIPKIIHQIWLGGTLPEKYLSLQKSWQHHHPDWEYHLWTDADLTDFPFTHRERFMAAINKGEQSDILRYEILYRYGGLYVDTDFECLKPFDLLHRMCDFYCGLEAKFPEHRRPAIGNALIGSIAGHPILKRCLEEIAKHETREDPTLIQTYTGPTCFCKAFMQLCADEKYCTVAFPFTTFYPLPAAFREEGVCKKKWVKDESFGIHYWSLSWLK